MIGRIQHPLYTAAALTAANPVLLKGEIVYEADTGRRKIGDGATQWVFLPYAADAEAVPALFWKVRNRMLYVKAATDIYNPILRRCSVGILHYKNAKLRKHSNPVTGVVTPKPNCAGFKLVQDNYAWTGLPWTSVRIDPVPYLAQSHDGWMPLISAQNLFDRWVERIPDPNFAGGGKFLLHMGTRTGDLELGKDREGKILMRVSFYAGVVLFTGNAQTRIEGPRSLFKVTAGNNYDSLAITHI